MADVSVILAGNLAGVRERIAAAARRAGRDPADITVVAVTKYVNAEAARVLHQLGVEDLGESRPQELWKKADAVQNARWHLVGHLQRNKVGATLPLVRLIHSVDSIRLLRAIEEEAARLGRVVEVLLEFNLSGESAKHGFIPSDRRGVAELVLALSQMRSVKAVGLMTMAAESDDPEQARPAFAALRRLRDELQPLLPDQTGVRMLGLSFVHELRHLSMGMSGDFEVAIEEGATLVRIGSALFRGLEGLEA